MKGDTLTNPEFVDMVNNAIKKVIDMNINRGHAQYQGKGYTGGSMRDLMGITVSAIGDSIPNSRLMKDGEMMNRWSKMDSEHREAVARDMNKVINALEGGNYDQEFVRKKLKAIKDHVKRRREAGNDVMEKIKDRAQKDTQDEIAIKQPVEEQGGKKHMKRGGQRKPRKDKGAKKGPSEWMKFVNEVSKMDKYKDLPRKEIMAVASKKYKKLK